MKTLKQTFRIPVTTTSTHDFCQPDNDSPHHPIDIAEQCFAFIKDTLLREAPSVRLPKFFDYALEEIVENAYDAYAKKGLVLGRTLKIRVGLQIRAHSVIINITDNGTGFSQFKAGEIFTLSQIKPENKNKKVYNGGAGIGLLSFEEMIKQGTLWLLFKNKQTKPGAIIGIKIPYLSAKM